MCVKVTKNYKKYAITYDPEAVGGYPYNVQLLHSKDGENWSYCGFGRFCRSYAEARAFCLAHPIEEV